MDDPIMIDSDSDDGLSIDDDEAGMIELGGGPARS